MMIFFFSSRRRHTRLQGDWSSDVCSSDLRHHHRFRWVQRHATQRPFLLCQLLTEARAAQVHAAVVERSEERRVGKESRSRWAQEQEEEEREERRGEERAEEVRPRSE